MSDGWTAMQCWEWPKMAMWVVSPVRAGHPLPGARLLHGLVGSMKYAHRVRWSRLPAVVARLRSWPEAPSSSAWASTG